MFTKLLAMSRRRARRPARPSWPPYPRPRGNWRMPPLGELPPPRLSIAVKTWMFVLRAYLVLAAGLVLLRIVTLVAN